MHRALGVIARATRSFRPASVQQPPKLMLSVSMNDQDNAEDQQRNDDEAQNDRKDMYIRAALVGFVLMVGQKMDDTLAHMFSWGSSMKRNSVKNRATSKQIPANDPTEDRLAYNDLSSVGGFVASVFDGHGGWQLSDYASKSLHAFIDSNFKALGSKEPTEEEVIAVINKSFDEVEQTYRDIALQAYDMGFPGLSKVGSCALACVVIGDKLYVANSGDCKAIMFRDEEGETVAVKLNHKLNACSLEEQARLKKEFSDEDIFVCKRNDPNACYVKGRLMPTRAFGDFYLKHKEFNNPQNLPRELGYRKIENFRGPYITHRPQIKVFSITPNDRGILLSSDGLYDELKTRDVLKLYNDNKKEPAPKLIEKLLDSALGHAAMQTSHTKEEMMKLPAGKQKRNMHDDLTLLYVNLEGQSSG